MAECPSCGSLFAPENAACCYCWTPLIIHTPALVAASSRAVTFGIDHRVPAPDAWTRWADECRRTGSASNIFNDPFA